MQHKVMQQQAQVQHAAVLLMPKFCVVRLTDIWMGLLLLLHLRAAGTLCSAAPGRTGLHGCWSAQRRATASQHRSTLATGESLQTQLACTSIITRWTWPNALAVTPLLHQTKHL
jgi:hypothetical protein